MKPNKLLALSLFCLLSVPQPAVAQEHLTPTTDLARLYAGVVEPPYEAWQWHDIPYYDDDTRFLEGRISYHGIVYNHVLLRFDLLKQQVVVLSPVGHVCCLPEQSFVDWFVYLSSRV